MLDIGDARVKMWVIVVYEGEKFLGTIQKIGNGKFNARCLEKALGITGPQLQERDTIDYDYAYKTNIQPKLSDIDANGKKTGSWFLVY